SRGLGDVYKRQVGVWDIRGGEAVILKPDWFHHNNTIPGSEYFNTRYLVPFIARVADALRTATLGDARKHYYLFIEGSPLGQMPSWPSGTPMPFGLVNESHWYDSLTLTAKRWTGFLAYDSELKRLILGPRAVRVWFRTALSRIQEHSAHQLGGVPTLLGEFGLPFDLNKRHAYRTGCFRTHEKALSAYYDALDACMMSATLWNYTADNTHEYGDGWNGEDLSVFCREDGGGRALRGFVRPYATAIAGKPVFMSFSLRSALFRFEYIPDFTIQAPTEVFVPSLQYPHGFKLDAEGVSVAETIREPDFSILALSPFPGAQRCILTVRRGRG
ncbi:MAG: hypothetical protein N3A02_00485, partial [Rectinema sp.]|nr:hypothetical protein [Rectinema sp.]